jgi:predicted ester cyclase
MSDTPSQTTAERAVWLATDYRIWSGGALVEGRAAFKEWVRQFQQRYGNAHTEILETFANATGDRVVSRWHNTGVNHGMFGLPADGRSVSFTGIAIWRVRDGRLAECWVERATFESYQRLTK